MRDGICRLAPCDKVHRGKLMDYLQGPDRRMCKEDLCRAQKAPKAVDVMGFDSVGERSGSKKESNFSGHESPSIIYREYPSGLLPACRLLLADVPTTSGMKELLDLALRSIVMDEASGQCKTGKNAWLRPVKDGVYKCLGGSGRDLHAVSTINWKYIQS